MLKPPFVTCCTIADCDGAVESRFGPGVPFEPAAARVWQLPQPCAENTVAPLDGAPTSVSVAGGVGPLGPPPGVASPEPVDFFPAVAAPLPSENTVSLSAVAEGRNEL